MTYPPYVQTMTERIQQRRIQILVHSYLYYQMDASYIEDHQFDRWCKQLVILQEQYPEDSMEARYYNEFKGFDGSSGYDLPYSMPNIQEIGNRLLQYMRDGVNNYV